MENLYRFYGINAAIEMLRPGATRWEVHNGCFTTWEDPRPCPSMKDIRETLEKIKQFEDSIPTIWLPEQIERNENTKDEDADS